MGRSLKKGPFVDEQSIKKIEEINEKDEKKVIKTWSDVRLYFHKW